MSTPEIPDSLNRMVPDSLADIRWSGEIIGDTVGRFGGDAAGTVRDSISAETIFGASSRLADLPDISAMDQLVTWAEYNPSALIDNIVFKLSVIVCFVAFCLLAYLFRGQIFALFNVFRGNANSEKLIGQQSRVFDIFLGWTIALGFLVQGMTAIKFIELAAGDLIAGGALSQWATLAMVPAAWGLCALIFGYKFMVLKTAGALTLSTTFTSRLFYLKKIIFALTTILLTPVFLVFVLSRGIGADITFAIVSIIIIGMTVFLIIRTFLFFIRQNLSISLWFLYLCAVEIFPASLIWIIAGKIL